MENAELYDDPRLLLEAKMHADGHPKAYQEIEAMTDEEVDQALRPYLKKDFERMKQFVH